MKLTRDNVIEVTRDCLYSPEEAPSPENSPPPEGAILVEGIIRNWGFHPQRLESHREDVRSMLSELSDQFMLSKGGGWSFMNASFTKDETFWGDQQDAECLICLAIGLNLTKFQLPKFLWEAFPGGVPYVTVLDVVLPESKEISIEESKEARSPS